MKKLLLLFVVLFVHNVHSQTIFKGLEYGMTKAEAKAEFKKNKADYTSIDIGNNFFYKTNKASQLFENDKLVGIWFVPKGYTFGMGYDNCKLYLEYTRTFFEDLGYEVFLEEKWWNAPLNYEKSGSKWGLVLNKPDKSVLVEMFPVAVKTGNTTGYYLNLKLWNYDTWVKNFESERGKQSSKIAESGF